MEPNVRIKSCFEKRLRNVGVYDAKVVMHRNSKKNQNGRASGRGVV